MKVLISGGAGFIGSYLTKELLKKGHEVVIHDSFLNYISPLQSNYQSLLKIRLAPIKDKVVIERGDIRHKGRFIKILKRHNPDKLVATEEDYDTFITKSPLLSTYLSSLFISNTMLLIGYSLGDPNLRHIWKVISDRLGKLRRNAYVLLQNPSQIDIARFERRGVIPITIPITRNYEEDLSHLFNQIFILWDNRTAATAVNLRQGGFHDLTMMSEAYSKICYFSIPERSLSTSLFSANFINVFNKVGPTENCWSKSSKSG